MVAAVVVRNFYADYALKDQRKSSAVRYHDNWGNTSLKHFHDFVEDEFPEIRGNIKDPLKTGVFFPNNKQVRPAPNFDQSDIEIGEPNTCSKQHPEKQSNITPGIITVCCTCSHPIIIGFKVLEGKEGTKTVLDILISRFIEMPKLMIYDFGCGLFRSTIHPL